MEETCPSCYSCGMPFTIASDHALGDAYRKFCTYCTDSEGRLKPYEEILIGMANYLAHSQGIMMTAATEIAQSLLTKQPHWKDLHAST